MKTLYSITTFVLLFLAAYTLSAQCGLQGDGTGGTVAPCTGNTTTITYTLPPGCCSGGPFWNWDISGMPMVSIDQNTTFPVPISQGNLNGSITGATATSFTIVWTCVPCSLGTNQFTLTVAASCIANETIRIACKPDTTTGGGNEYPCLFDVKETECNGLNCIQFEQLGYSEQCCRCVRVAFNDGTVLYSIIGVGQDNITALCYEKGIANYTMSSVPCEDWCALQPTGDPTEKVHSGAGAEHPLQFFPNPAEDQRVQVHYDSPIEGPITFEITDLAGRVLMSRTVDARKGLNEWTVDCAACTVSQPYNVVVIDGDQQILDHKMLLLNQK